MCGHVYLICLQDKLDVFCPLQPHASAEQRSFGFCLLLLVPDVTLTVFSLGLELSANILRMEGQLKEFAGASLFILEVQEICKL